jgi:hypothetical protein
MRFKILFFPIALLITVTTVNSTYAQTEDYEISSSAYHDTFHFNLTGMVGIPSKELKEAVQNNFGDIGVGFATSVLLSPFGKKKPSPILMGIDFSYLTYGVDKIDESSFNPPLKTTFNVYNISAAFRFLPKQSEGFAPFVDGMVGSRIFNTRTKIDKDVLDTIVNDDQPEVINTSNDAGLCYTLGIGFFNRKSNRDQLKGSFTMRILYTWGDDAEYIIRDSIKLDSNNFVTYETGRTRTDMFLIQLGFTLH